MVKILIISVSGDVHVESAFSRLERLGHTPVFWQTDRFPEQQTHSVYINDDTPPIWTCRDSADAFTNGFDAVWLRRLSLPTVPGVVHNDDKEFVQDELNNFFYSLLKSISEESFWVNPLSGRRAANSKIKQLSVARSCGFRIPDTLFSNNPDDVCNFIKTLPKFDSIFKTFSKAQWDFEKDRPKATFTSTITLDDLPHEEFIVAAPGIYQRRIQKSYEVRLTMLGKFPVAVKIDSQSFADGALDWHNIYPPDLPIEPIELPNSIVKKCICFMNEMNIVFGCFDFIVTQDNDYVFVEVNESGQWLWIEERCPEIPILNLFCDFLVRGTTNFDV